MRGVVVVDASQTIQERFVKGDEVQRENNTFA